MAKEFKPTVFNGKDKVWVNFPSLCKGCGLCIEKCPRKALTFDNTKNGHLGTPAVKCNIDICIACGLCELHCPDNAIRVDKK